MSFTVATHRATLAGSHLSLAFSYTVGETKAQKEKWNATQLRGLRPGSEGGPGTSLEGPPNQLLSFAGSGRAGYTPGCGPELALASARRRRPAVGSTPPRPSCSLAGSWPEERHWQRDLMDEGKDRAHQGGVTLSGVKDTGRDPFLKDVGVQDSPLLSPSLRMLVAGGQSAGDQSMVSLMLLLSALPCKTLTVSTPNPVLRIGLPGLGAGGREGGRQETEDREVGGRATPGLSLSVPGDGDLPPSVLTQTPHQSDCFFGGL